MRNHLSQQLCRMTSAHHQRLVQEVSFSALPAVPHGFDSNQRRMTLTRCLPDVVLRGCNKNRMFLLGQGRGEEMWPSMILHSNHQDVRMNILLCNLRVRVPQHFLLLKSDLVQLNGLHVSSCTTPPHLATPPVFLIVSQCSLASLPAEFLIRF